MIELGQLERRHEDFENRHVRVVAVSLESREDAARSQEQFPHLTFIADKGGGLSAAAEVVGSGTVGPDAITDGSSPGTSEIISETTGAGAAAIASLPPLIADRCLRTVFISPI